MAQTLIKCDRCGRVAEYWKGACRCGCETGTYHYGRPGTKVNRKKKRKKH